MKKYNKEQNNYSKKSNNRNNGQRSNSKYSNKNNTYNSSSTLNKESKNRNYPQNTNDKRFNNNSSSNNNVNSDRKLLGNKRSINHSIDEDWYSKKNNPTNNNTNNSNRYNYNNMDNSNRTYNGTSNQKNINSFNSQNFSSQKELPIFPYKEEILQKISQNRITIISGNTGCGKSTQIPQYIYQSNPSNKILMTQPRRIAAISISKRLAEEMGERIGKKIGYHVSMKYNYSNETKILVETTGVFLEELIHRNMEYTHIIIDEVHERDIYVDLVLAMIKWYFEENQRSRIKLILMSATIAEEKFAEYLKEINGDEVPIIRIKESLHEIYEFNLEKIYYNIKNDPSISKTLKEEIILGSSIFNNMQKDTPCFLKELFPVCAALIEKINDENKHNKNGILIFVPGLAEIHDLLDYLQNFFEQKLNYLEFLILHSQIADADQDKIFKINNKRKIILATNIAESSITISNIDFVIDFCLVKQTRFDPNQNTSFLELKWCSKSSCRQRKGRIGRVNTGFYIQLIRSELYESLNEHPVPEILRISLENPILKLKIYEPEREPNDILLKTITPPDEELILRTIFKLEKMGALIKGKVLQDDYYNTKKVNYKSGIITTVGKIFAELPLDIKYSRLIIISYALGQIEVGITLASILSQDRPIFLSSDKTNRLSIYEIKSMYSLGKECDFITLYTAYKKWYYKYGYLLLNTNVKFDTILKRIDSNTYLEMVKYAKDNILDLKILKEVMKVENDIRKRLTKFGIYCPNFESYKDEKRSLNFNLDENVLILKIILTGTFYNQIYVPEYENTKNIAMDLFNSKDEEDQKELKTVRMQSLPFETAKKVGEIFNAMVEPYEIINMDYDDTDKYRIEFNKVEAVKKILFITSSNNRRNNELIKFCFKKDLDAKNKGSKTKKNINNINNNNTDKNTNNNNTNDTKDESDDELSLIKLDRDLEYYYRLYYFDENMREYVNQYKDSINFIQIIPKWEKLKSCKLVTDNFHGKLTKNNSFYKFAKNSSVLPTIENFDKLIMLVFAPKYEMIGTKDNKTGKYLRYKGFQGYEFAGLNAFTNFVNKEANFNYQKLFLVKFEYLITNYHLNIINEIRVLINEIMKFKFVAKNNKYKSNEPYELSKEEFDELYLEYKNKSDKIVEHIKKLLSIPQVKNISDETYQELFEYINDIKYKNKRIRNLNNEKDSKDKSKESNDISVSSDNKINDDEEEDNDSSEKTQSKNYPISYPGYINSIYELQKKVNNDDFLQLHEPLKIEEEFYFTDNNTLKELKSRNYKIKNLYNDFLTELSKISRLAMARSGYLACAHCEVEISRLDKGIPVMTDIEIGEHKIQKQWLNENMKEIYKIKKGKQKKKFDIDDKQIEEFKSKLDANNIKYDNICCCLNEKHVIGYSRNGENFIYYGTELGVKYPDLSFELVDKKESFVNDFVEYKMKLEKILAYRNTDEFKSKIICKLCNFCVKEDMMEFNRHLESAEHKYRLKELRKEFA